MGLYKSVDTDGQLQEVMSSLRSEIKKEYKNMNSDDYGYKKALKEIKELKATNFKLKFDVKKRIFHSQNFKFERASTYRKIDVLKEKAEKIISDNPRIELSNQIYDKVKDLDEDKKKVGLIAVEQLFQEERDVLQSDKSSEVEAKRAFDSKELNRLRNCMSYNGLLNTQNEIDKQCQKNLVKTKYLDSINSTTSNLYPNEKEVFKDIEFDIDEDRKDASKKLDDLKEKIIKEHELYGIKTGQDFSFKELFKKMGNSLKNFVNNVKNKSKNPKALPEFSSVRDTSKNSFSNKLNGMVENNPNYSPKSKVIEQKDKNLYR